MTQPLPDFDLESFLPYRFSVIAARMSAELSKHYKREFGISMPEWRVLLNVGYAENPSIRDIKKRVSLEKSKVSRAAAKLEAKGLLTKRTDDIDRRLLKLTLTSEGSELLSNIIPLAQKLQTKLNASLGAQENALQAALDQISDTLND